MELRVNEPGLFIEELVFQIRPELVKRYVELEYEIMAKELAGLDGFCGWQIWVSETNPPARSVLESALPDPSWKVQISTVAVVVD